MKVENGKKVKLEYELSLENGEVIESSSSRGPIEYIHGTGSMLAGLEKQIEGLEVQDTKEGLIPASEAYGTEETLPQKNLNRNEFPQDAALESGKVFQAQDANGNPVSFTVIEVKDDEITVRFNHPLAGKTIHYKVKILDIIDPS